MSSPRRHGPDLPENPKQVIMVPILDDFARDKTGEVRELECDGLARWWNFHEGTVVVGGNGQAGCHNVSFGNDLLDCCGNVGEGCEHLPERPLNPSIPSTRASEGPWYT